MQSDKPQRIGYVLKRYPKYSETFIVNEILAHEEAGLDIEIFSLRPPNDACFQDAISRVRAPVHYLPESGIKTAHFWSTINSASQAMPEIWNRLRSARYEDYRSVHQAILLAQHIAKQGITHLHAHFVNVATTVARLAAYFSDIPYSMTAHAKDIFHESVDHTSFKRNLIHASSTVTVSDFNLHHLRQTYGDCADRTQRIYNGLDLDRFAYTPPTARQPRIVSVGRLVEKKGMADLIDSCAILTAQGIGFSCRIIGTGELEDELRQQINGLGLQDKVELLGPRPQRQIRQIIQDASVFAAPCVVGKDGNRDGLPTVLLESMALGTPCVATDVTGIPEILRDNETGLMVPQHEPQALATAIARLLRDGDLRVRMAREARQRIESDFDVRENTARQRSLFSPGVQTASGCSLEAFV